MAHANGKEAVAAASHYGVDSIEHGNFIDWETMEILAENHTLYVPTAATVFNLLGCVRFPDKEIQTIMDTIEASLHNARDLHVPTALGSDAGAYLVPHGQGILDEHRIFQDILGASSELDEWLTEGENLLKERFQPHRT